MAGVVIPQPPLTTLQGGEAASTVSRRGCILWRNFSKACRRSPYAWPKPTLVYPAGSASACVTLASKLFGGEFQTREIAYGSPNTFELWIPPLTVGAKSTEQRAMQFDPRDSK
ncbi:MAG: hypothetical protein IPK54_07705 [Dokdonella sp.]|uniref:hypothetical protein n=1 Tax=Dokdonella sp. TaxID=2291710 RepID=UPI0025BDC8CD|nr:hypothetical protein [Dokdonella sp.]MBK8123427.1 hypothetical protein [Dokdonella sp.]